MAEQEKTTQAHRFGAWAGSWWRRWRVLEDRQLKRVQDSGMRHGRLLVRSVFRGGDLLMLAGLLLVGFGVALPVLLTVGLGYLITRSGDFDPSPGSPEYDQIDHPDHRTHWPERYDEWGSLK
jgi:hypothetical protein